MYKIPLSPYSKQFYEDWKFDPGRMDDNILSDQYIDGSFEVWQFDEAIKKVIESYLLVNSHIENDNGYLYWVKNKKICGIDHFEQPLLNGELFTYMKNPFNLERGPLYRFAVIKYGENKYRLIILLHHIIINGITADFFLKEISNYYNDSTYVSTISIQDQQEKLTKLFTRLNRQFEENKDFQRKFWSEQLFGVQSVNLDFLRLKNSQKVSEELSQGLNLPMDEIVGTSEIRFQLPDDTLEKLNRLKRVYKITAYLYGQSIYALLVYFCTNQTKFCISYSVSIPESLSFIYGAQINTGIAIYDFNKISNVEELIIQAKKFFRQLKGDKFKYSDFPISNLLSLSSQSLLELSFDQAHVRMQSTQFNNVSTKINYEINIDLYQSGELWFGQEVYKDKINYSILFNLKSIDKDILNDFIKVYKRLFLRVLDSLVNEHEHKTIIDLERIRGVLTFEKEFSKFIYINKQSPENYHDTHNLLPKFFFDKNYQLPEESKINQIFIYLNAVDAFIKSSDEITLLVGNYSDVNDFMNYIFPEAQEINLNDYMDVQKSYFCKIWKTKSPHKIYFYYSTALKADSVLQNILSVFLLRRFLEIANEIKSILVVPAYYMESGGHLLVQAIQRLLKFFLIPKDFEDRIILVISQKNSKLTNETVREEISDILNEQESELDLNQINALENFCSKLKNNIFCLNQETHENLEVYKKDFLSCFNNIRNIDRKTINFPLSEESKRYIHVLFEKMSTRIGEGFKLLCEMIKLKYISLLENQEFSTINLFIHAVKEFYNELEMKHSFSRVINILDLKISDSYCNQVQEIKKNLIFFDFFKKSIKKENNFYLVNVTKNYFSELIDFILGNKITALMRLNDTIISDFIQDIEIYIEHHKNICFLNKIVSFNEFFSLYKSCEMSDTLYEFFGIFELKSLPKTMNYIKVLKTLDNSCYETFIISLKSEIKKLFNKIYKEMAILNEVNCVEVDSKFTEICNLFVKIHQESSNHNSIGEVMQKIDSFRTLILFLEKKNEITLKESIKLFEEKLTSDSINLCSSEIIFKISQLRKLEQSCHSDKFKNENYLDKLIEVFKIIQVNYQLKLIE